MKAEMVQSRYDVLRGSLVHTHRGYEELCFPTSGVSTQLGDVHPWPFLGIAKSFMTVGYVR
jgi:hypothetical protein